MTVFERTELEASPLADLHAIAGQVGLEGFRRMRKADLVAAILQQAGADGADVGAGRDDEDGRDGERAAAREDDEEPARETGRRARAARGARGGGQAGRRRAPRSRRSREELDGGEADEERGARAGGDADEEGERSAQDMATAGASPTAGGRQAGERPARIAAGVVEVLGNGSAFLRVEPPEPSDDDVYISAAQVRRCELVSGDRVTGPVRTPRRSERYPSLVRIDTINGASADTVADGARYEDLPAAWPTQRLALGSDDPTLEAIEWMTPLGLGSRATIVGPRAAGKSETLRRLLAALEGREELELSLVLAGARPEEVAQWREGPIEPAAALTFVAGVDLQDQAVERAIDGAKRVAARGGDALVAIDSLDALHPHVARKALAAARNLREGGSLTVIAVAERPVGGETTVITLDPALTQTGRQPIVDLVHSGTMRPELLVGEDGAAAIAKTRLAAVEAA